MINKKIMFGMIFLLVMILSLNFISADCCEELKDGGWCQNIDDEDKCKEDSKLSPTSCSSTNYCKKGTCISSQEGKCMINTPKATCVESGGNWVDKDPREISQCQPGCCLYGDQSAFVTQTECKQIASDHGVNVNFKEDITSETQCLDLSDTGEEGACVIENEYQTTCLRTTKEECMNKKDNKGSSDILELFNVSSGERSNIKIDFYPGVLCTAEELNTDCADTDRTRCEDDKVHFVDTCGNLANVYDENMYPMEKNDEARNYWTEIQEPKCEIEGTTSSSCGDCNYRTGTICATYNRNDEGMPSDAPEYGNKVCRDLACYHDGERYEHGESWCAETPGTYPHLPINKSKIQNGTDIWKDLTSLEGMTEKYNIPGSRYVKLECRNGRVLEQPCKDYRNEFCAEQVSAETEHPDGDGVYTQASCVPNNWRTCINITSRSECESPDTMCKWVEGYRFDYQNTLHNKGNEDEILLKESDSQGSCVPLVSPGFDFWNSSGNAYQGAIRENVLYEVGVTRGRDRDDLESDSSWASQRCYSQNCYAIPGYGSDVSESDWKEIWDGDKGQIKIRDNEYLSYRKGAYCTNKTGTFTGKQPDCTKSSGGNDKIAKPPIFMNHTQWINSLIFRARSLGDVGYKRSIGDYWGEKSAERVVSQLQRLNQDTEVKDNMTDEIVMYEAGEYTEENQRKTNWIGQMFNELNGNSKERKI